MRYLRLVGTISSLVALPPFVHSFALATVVHDGQKTNIFKRSFTRSSQTSSKMETMAECDDRGSDILPFETGSHNSAKIIIPSAISHNDPFLSQNITMLFQSTVLACKMNDKSSIWVHVPMTRSSIIEDGQLYELGFRFHHAVDDVAVLNLWLRDSESKVPDFSTHNVGVGAFVVNSQNQILCVRGLRKNYMPWKTPTGTSELGESIEDAAIREVLEETGIQTTFHSILGFRQTHGMAHGRSDLYFVCRLDPIEEQDDNGNVVIPTPCAQACEIETAEWVPFDDYKRMVDGEGSQKGHPMMSHVVHAYEMGRMIEKKVVESVVPGRLPNHVYFAR
jgi:ADP-ribose pyrophosphatase YjhB (NUDIX family)